MTDRKKCHLLLILAGIFMFLFTRCDSCESFAEDFRPKEYYFRVTRKYDDGRYNVFEGKNKKGVDEIFREVGYREESNATCIGDTLIKLKGSLEIKIVKRDSVLIFYWKCNGRIIK